MTASVVVVRPAVLADADALWPLVRDFATSFTPERSTFENTLGQLLVRDDTLVSVSVSDGAVVGYVLASTHPTLFANAPVAWVEELMVEAGVRRAGAGSALMGEAERWAAQKGAAYLSLATRRASEFYLALGYEDSATFFRKRL